MMPLRLENKNAINNETPGRWKRWPVFLTQRMERVMAFTDLSYQGPIVTREAARDQGCKRYFTGQPCARGHIAQRTVANHSCIVCNKINYASRKNANPEYYRAYWRQRIATNRDKHNAYQMEWRAKNQEIQKAIKKKSYEKHKDRRQADAKKYHYAKISQLAQQGQEALQKYLNKQSEKTKRWTKENPEKALVQRRNKRARRAAAEGRHTAEDIELIFVRQKGTCAIPTCRANLNQVGQHVDHITPLSKGGSNWPKNLQLLCPPCNLSKHAKDPIDFMRERGFLL